VLNEDGDVLEAERIATNAAAKQRYFEGEPGQRVAMECEKHLPWIHRLLKKLGHQVK
jgi:hypothetical protein